ncbi:MAG TPA: CDP-alcohol phosphatidyltransferase family protein [Gemmatimonadaceae bacterium]|nr:CDP-alcohol phosphatidyltransferase family protein [Gemmatimonadaceae bacterium]
MPVPRIFSLPNLLSIVRFPLAAAFLLAETTGMRLALLGMASASDLLDGWMARRLGRTSRWGAMLDPIADKTFMLAAFTAFLIYGEVTAVQWGILLSRDLAVAVGAVVAALTPGLSPASFMVRMSGKIVTVLQLAAILLLTVRPEEAAQVVMIVGVASFLTIADYTLALARTREQRD